MLDRYLAKHNSPLRGADLTPDNASALRFHPWRENLVELEDVALRLDAIVGARFRI